MVSVGGIPQSIGQAGFVLQDQLNAFLGLSAQVGANGTPRNAMVFTSTLRQAIKKAPTVTTPSVIAAQGGAIPSAGASLIPPSPFQDDVKLAPIDPGAFFKNLSAVQRQILMAVNPKSVRFRQPKRFAKKDVMNGSVFFHFTNTKGQNNDILTMEFRGNTGDLNRNGAIDVTGTNASASNGAFAKLAAWHNLYLLTREPMILNNGQENKFIISYVSPLIPVVIDFEGFFNEVLEFEENGEKPNSRDYSMTFTVTGTTPDLDELLSEVQQVISGFQAAPTNGAQIFGTLPDSIPQSFDDGSLVNQ